VSAQARRFPAPIAWYRSCGPVEPADIDAVAALIGSGRDVEHIERSAPYENRRDPGVRLYLTVRIAPKEFPHA